MLRLLFLQRNELPNIINSVYFVNFTLHPVFPYVFFENTLQLIGVFFWDFLDPNGVISGVDDVEVHAFQHFIVLSFEDNSANEEQTDCQQMQYPKPERNVIVIFRFAIHQIP